MLARTITRGIAGAAVADARRRLVEDFGAIEVRIDSRDGRDTIPAAGDLRVQIRS